LWGITAPWGWCYPQAVWKSRRHIWNLRASIEATYTRGSHTGSKTKGVSLRAEDIPSGYMEAQPLPPPIRHVRTVALASAMRGTPNIPDAHIPRPVVELPDLPDIDPAPVFTYFNLIVRTDSDAPPALLKGGELSGADHPFADPLPLIGPHRNVDLI